MKQRLFCISYGIITLLCGLMSSGTALAQSNNICVEVIMDVVLPPTPKQIKECRVSGVGCVALPHCCVPGACLLDPSCYGWKTIIEKAKTISAGETYCDFSAKQLFEQWKADNIANIADMLTGGLSSEFIGYANTDIDAIAKVASYLRPPVKDALKDLIRPFYDNGASAPSWSDIDNIRVVSNKEFNAGWYLRDGFAAITLGPVVVMNDEDYRTLFNNNNNYSLEDIQWKRATPAYANALSLMAHELVHVGQYRRYGRDTFLVNYVFDAIINGYQDNTFEKEAYSFEEKATYYHGGSYCQDNTFKDSRCKPYGPFAAGILTVFGHQ